MKALLMSEQVDDVDLPVNVDSLDDLLATLRGAVGALGSQADQIGQMRGMFDDEDGTIQNAVDDGEHAEARLGNAIAFVEQMIAERQHDAAIDASMDEQATAFASERNERAADDVAQAIAAGVAPPSAAALLDARTGMLTQIAERRAGFAEDGLDPDDATIEMPAADATGIATLLLASAVAVHALDKPEPVEVLVNCTGGVVQDVIVVDGQNPVIVYVEDNDEDEEIGADENPELAHLQNEDGNGDDPEFSASLYRTRGSAFSGTGRRWTTLRAEADRLERNERALTLADFVGGDD